MIMSMTMSTTIITITSMNMSIITVISTATDMTTIMITGIIPMASCMRSGTGWNT